MRNSIKGGWSHLDPFYLYFSFFLHRLFFSLAIPIFLLMHQVSKHEIYRLDEELGAQEIGISSLARSLALPTIFLQSPHQISLGSKGE